MVAMGSPFGAEVPRPLDADDWERLAQVHGRYLWALLDRVRAATAEGAPSGGGVPTPQVI